MSIPTRWSLTIVAVLASLPVPADTLWYRTGSTGNPIEISNTRITKVEGDKIFFTTLGRETSRELQQITRMMIDNEPAFNDAEAAYAAQDWKRAVDGYQKTVHSTTKPWLRDWCSFRLAEAAGKSGQFDAATTAYVGLVMKDPALAARYKPAVPEGNSGYLAPASAEIARALQDQKLSPAQRIALLSFAVEIDLARGNKADAGKWAAELEKLKPATPPAGRAGINTAESANAKSMVEAKLSLTQLDLANKQYDKVLADIDAAKAAITDPAQQADALFFRAEALYGKAAQKNDDPAALADAALAYVRLVAFFKGAQGQPHVADSLMKVAEIHEKLKEPRTALKLYQQVVAQFPGDPAAAKAREQITRLESAEKSG